MEQLITNRRSCRRFLDKNVDPEIISSMLAAMSAAPTGGNAQGVEYTVIDDKNRVHEVWKAAYSKMEEDAKRHIYTHSFSDFYYSKMKESEKTVRKDDLFFCGAPTSLSLTDDVWESGPRTARSTALLPRHILSCCATPTALERPS